MMHTMWKGAISFGLVHIPVKMFSATEEKDISLNYLHHKCGTPVSNSRSCTTCNEVVDWADVVQGYEFEKNRFVIFDKEELAAIKGQEDKTIQIIDFVKQDDLDPVYFQKSYYLGTDEFGVEAYQLLCTALQASKKVAIAKVTIRSKSHLAALRVKNKCFVLEMIHYGDEVRDIELVPRSTVTAKANKQELALAIQLIERLSTTFTPEKYKDEQRIRLSESIQKKIAGERITMKPTETQPNRMGLMDALQASVELYTKKNDEKSKGISKKKKEQEVVAQQGNENQESAS